jgi:hypothetical protein
MKLILAFRIFANAPKSQGQCSSCRNLDSTRSGRDSTAGSREHRKVFSGKGQEIYWHAKRLWVCSKCTQSTVSTYSIVSIYHLSKLCTGYHRHVVSRIYTTSCHLIFVQFRIWPLRLLLSLSPKSKLSIISLGQHTNSCSSRKQQLCVT